jgi:hypothetical protein
MVHDTLIAVHAVAGTVALVAGVVLVGWGRLFALWFWSLMMMAVALAAAVTIGWGSEPAGTNGVFLGLLALAAFMVARAVQARRWRPGPGTAPSARFLDAVGFTLISLFDGFVIVAVLTRGGPAWLAITVGVLGVLVGRSAVHRATMARTRQRPAAHPA